MFLDHQGRPTELFNPANKKHRQYYAEFLKSGTWGNCPCRFEVQDEGSNRNLAYAMQRMLTEYYMAKEFKIPVDN